MTDTDKLAGELRNLLNLGFSPGFSSSIREPAKVKFHELITPSNIAALLDARARDKALIEKMAEALTLYDVYKAMLVDRGGKNGPRGRAYQDFVDAKVDVLDAYEEARK